MKGVLKLYKKMFRYGILIPVLTVSLISSANVSAKKHKAQHIGVSNVTNATVLNVSHDEMGIYSEPEKDKTKKIGILYKNSMATVIDKDSEDDWYKVESGEVTGWIKKNEVISGKKDVDSYILGNMSDFDVDVTTKDATGQYTSIKDLKHDNFSYTTIGEFKTKDKSIKFYKSPNTGKYKVDNSKRVNYCRVIRKKTGLLSLSSGKAGVVKRVKKDKSFKVINDLGSHYEVHIKDKSYFINKFAVKTYTKGKVVKNKPVKVKYGINKAYDVISDNNGVVQLSIGKHKYYTKRKNVYLIYLSNGSKSVSIAGKDMQFDVKAVNKKKKVLKIQQASDLTDTKLNLYMPINKNKLSVNFDEASKYEYTPPVAKEESTKGDVPNIDLSKMNKNGTYKGMYSYDYANNSTDKRNAIVNYALRFLGNRYVYGGTDLYRGIDCSAYCMRIYQHFGISIARDSNSQWHESRGKKISLDDVQPGDLIYYSRDGRRTYHVVMYLGGDKCVNASCAKYGICISTIKKDRIIAVKNYID